MSPLKIGIRLESLGLPLRPALALASRLGVSGVQFDAVGDLAPNRLSETGRRELRHLLHANDLELTAVGCPLRRGLDSAHDQQPRLEHVQKVLALSFDLGPRLVIIEAGAVPQDETTDLARRLRESLDMLGRYGDRVGAVLALETGPDSGEALAAYLRSFDTGALGANYDPANLLMHGMDPFESGRALAGLVRHAHAKDARRGKASRSAQEVPLGAGDLDWLRLMGLFVEIEYRGWLVVERESGENRQADVASGVALLRRLLP